MSSNLNWKRIEPEEPDGRGSTGLKLILQKHYGSPVDVELSEEDIPFLKGVAAASDDDSVGELIAAIERFGAVRVWEQF